MNFSLNKSGYFGLVSEPVVILGLASIIIYGLLMEPTPESYTYTIVLWAFLSAPAYIASIQYVRVFAIYILPLVGVAIIGLSVGALFGAEPIKILRDLLPILFWIFTPLFLYYLVNITAKHMVRDDALEMLRLLAALSGMLLSLRYVLDIQDGIHQFFHSNIRENMQYLSSEPLVTYAFAYFSIKIFSDNNIRSALIYFLFAGLSAVGLVAVTYRGPLLIGLSLLVGSAFLYMFGKFTKYPVRVIFVLFVFLVFLWEVAPILESIFDKITNKFDAVGFNSKLDEFIAIFLSSSSPFEVLFGSGFGAEKYVIGATTTVTYTHNLLSYIYLKVGMIGVALLSMSAAYLAINVIKRERLYLTIMPELLTIFYISLFQGAFKHYGFSIVVGLCCVSAIRSNKQWHQETERCRLRDLNRCANI